jgi:hypothetical protein
MFTPFAFIKSPSLSPSSTATGGTITYEGIYTVHTFTASDSFIVNTNYTMSYLLVGGGGGGYEAGGSGGQVLSGSMTISSGTYSIEVGQGGTNEDFNTVGTACYGTETTALEFTASFGKGTLYTPEWGTWIAIGNDYTPCGGVRFEDDNPGAGSGAAECATTDSPDGGDGQGVIVANRSIEYYGAGGRSAGSPPSFIGNNGLGYGNPGSGGSGAVNAVGLDGIVIIWYVTP